MTIEQQINIYYKHWCANTELKNKMKRQGMKSEHEQLREECEENFEDLENRMPLTMMLDFTAPLSINDDGLLCVSSYNIGG